MLFRALKILPILLLAGLALPASALAATGPSAITATFNGVPASWLQDSNPAPTASNPGSQLTQPSTPRYALVLAAKAALTNDIANATPVTAGQVSDLAAALGVQLSAPTGASPLAELAAVTNALSTYAETVTPPMASTAARTKRSVRRATAPNGGGCDSNNCWIDTPVETSEPTSDPAGSHPTTIAGNPNTGWFANLCGPGSSTETMGNWTPDTVLNWSSKHGSGPQAYLLGMADNEMSWTGGYNGYDQKVYWTLYSAEVDTLNNFIGSNFYILVTTPTDSQWWAEMNQDESGSSHIPAVFAANTSELVDWGGNTDQDHLIVATTVGTNGHSNITYYDTATSYASNTSGTNGFQPTTRGAVELNGGLLRSIY